jgi:DNA-binding transcriptional MerR regulator
VELTIGQLSERSGVTRRTIRYYIEIGLLPPPSGTGKVATYGQEHLERLELIKALQAYRLSLEEIRDRLAGKAEGPRQMAIRMADAAALPSPPYEPSSASEYIARLRERGPAFTQARSEQLLRQAALFARDKPQTDYDAEPWLRIALSDDVELHVRRRASRMDRRLSRLIKEARRILAEEEVE